MRNAILGGLTALALAWSSSPASADVGPVDPSRRICMGLEAGTPCKIDGKDGTCQGPHASRMYCTPTSTDSGSGSAAGPSVESAPTPGHKRGCAVGDPGSAAALGLACAALLARRRRRQRAQP